MWMFVLAKGNILMLRSLVVDWGADRTLETNDLKGL